MEDNDDDESEEGGAGVGVDGDDTNVSAQDSSIDGHDTVDEGDNSCSGTDDEYSYVYELSSDENEESAATTRDPAPSFASAAAAAAANKGKGTNPLAELDQALARLNSLFPEAINTQDQEFLDLVSTTDNFHSLQRESESGGRTKAKLIDTSKLLTSASYKKKGSSLMSASSKIKTSAVKAGVGYETGRHATSASALKREMIDALGKQQKIDDECSDQLQALSKFLKSYEGDEGTVLLAAKMSPGLNRMIFSIFKNTPLLEWGKRPTPTLYALDFVDALCESKFLSTFLLHDLLEGDGSPDHTSNCQILLEALDGKASIMKTSQERILARRPSSVDGNNIMISTEKTAIETSEATNTIEVCKRIAASYDKVKKAIEHGRTVGTISNVFEDFAIAERLDGDVPHTEEEDKAIYNMVMKQHRLKYVELIEAVKSGKTAHRFVIEATKASISPANVQPKRMIRIASEIAGLLQDLPVQWASGIFVRADEERPDILKACIMAPEGTPYESGCFEFDILLPLNYPFVPPKVFLVTTAGGTCRFNPNLYMDGKVCLSLLGTWEGPSWIPEISTLLQVLVSIQSLIFVPDPYFNEPGYDASDEIQQKFSKVYDAQIRAATLKVGILDQMLKPSPIFRDCIHDHFRLKRRSILKQLSEWENLARNEDLDSTKINSGNAPFKRRIDGGGMCRSHASVKGYCDGIRLFISKKWPQSAKGDNR